MGELDFAAIRWAANDGKPYCPWCGCRRAYALKKRKVFRCTECKRDFTLTTGTILAGHKLPLEFYLDAIEKYMKAPSVRQLSFDLKIQYKSAYVFAGKIREALETSGGAEASDIIAALITAKPRSGRWRGYWQARGPRDLVRC